MIPDNADVDKKNNRQFRDEICEMFRRDCWQDPTFLTQFVARTYIRGGAVRQPRAVVGTTFGPSQDAFGRSSVIRAPACLPTLPYTNAASGGEFLFDQRTISLFWSPGFC